MGSPRDWLRLARAPLATTAAADSAACALLARGPGFSSGGGPAAGARDWALLAATSVLLYAGGMIANDVADRRRDATIHPERPIPSRRISALSAAVVAAACLAGAVALAGGPLGSRAVAGAAVVAIVAYDGGLKRFLALGAAAMGVARAANASLAVWPLVEAGTASPWAMAGPACLGLYSAGVTVLSTAEDRPFVHARRLLAARVAAFAAFGGAAVLSLLGAGGTTLGLFVAAGVVVSVAFGRVPRRGTPRAQVLEMLLGFHYLELVLATGGFAGDDWAAALSCAGGAIALLFVANLGVLALRPRAPSTAT